MTIDRLTTWIALLRDLVCLAAGAWGFQQQISGGTDMVGMTACLLLLGGPALLRAWLSPARTQDTPPLPGSPPAPPSPPPLSSSSSAAGEP